MPDKIDLPWITDREPSIGSVYIFWNQGYNTIDISDRTYLEPYKVKLEVNTYGWLPVDFFNPPKEKELEDPDSGQGGGEGL